MTKILVVDDEENMLILYKRELMDEGYQVATAADGLEALERYCSDRPDIVLLDVRMPGMDGLQVLARMLSADRGVPIILLSAYSSFCDDFTSWSADACITKSSDLNELKAAIKSLRPACPRCGSKQLPECCGQQP